MKKISITLTAVLFTALSTMAQIANKDNSEPTTGTILSTTDATADQGLVTNGSDAVSWGAQMLSANVGTNYSTVVNNTTGQTWLDRNLGASQVATASNDANAYGDLYQWGRATDGHQIRTSNTYNGQASTWIADIGTNAWDGKFCCGNCAWLSTAMDDLWTGTNAKNNPCPSGFRLPTNAELNQERRSWVTGDNAGAFASPLKLPTGGGRNASDGSFCFVGSYGNYWSSTVSGTVARHLQHTTNNSYVGHNCRGYGFSVRCIKD